MPTTHRARAAGAALLLALTVGGLASCGEDDGEAADATTTTAPATTTAATEPADPSGAGLEDYCAVAEELNGAAAPTAEQIDEWAALAPEEIAEPAATFVAAFEAADGDLGVVFADPEATAAIEEITAFEAEACGISPPGPPAGG